MKLQAYRCIKSFFIESSIIKRTYHCTTLAVWCASLYTFSYLSGKKNSIMRYFNQTKIGIFLLIIVCDLGVRLLNCTIFLFWKRLETVLAWFSEKQKVLRDEKLDCMAIALVLNGKKRCVVLDKCTVS